MMENNTTISAVAANCRLSPKYEHEPLWIIPMLVVSAISTLTAMIFRKRRVRASAHPRAPFSSPPQPRDGRAEKGEEEMV